MNAVPSHVTLLTVVWVLCICFNGSLSIISRENNSLAPSYDDMTSYEEDLVQQIYAGYPKKSNVTGIYPNPKGSNVIAHPVKNIWSVETEVIIWITLEDISHLDVENQHIELTVEETYFWKDEHFKREGYNDTDHIEISRDKIWTPEILPDGVYKHTLLTETSTIRVKLNNGYCYDTKQKLYTIPCRVNVQPFPFDIHDCSLRLFQRERYTSRMKFIPSINEQTREEHVKKGNRVVDLITSEFSAQNLHSNSGTLDWVIKDFNSTVIKRKRSNNDPFDTDEYLLELIISRRSVFYATVLIFPCILLNLLSFVIFTLPLKDTERENFAVTLILTYFVLIMIVVDASPSSGNDLPLLGLYIILSMCVVLVNFVVSLVLIEIHEHCREKHRRMPSWLTKCLDSKCVIKCFTNKRHFQQDDNANNASGDELMETEDRLMQSVSKKKAKRLVSRAKDEYKWKVFCKVLNFIFFVLSIIAHLILALVMYLKLPAQAESL